LDLQLGSTPEMGVGYTQARDFTGLPFCGPGVAPGPSYSTHTQLHHIRYHQASFP
jgi:hypothetical protein